MTPAHQSPERRWRVLVVLVLVVAIVAVVAGTRNSAPAAPRTPASMVGAPDAESTAWFCTGQSTSSGAAPGELVLTNTGPAPTTGTVTELSDTGTEARTQVAIPARGVVVPKLRPPASGSSLAQVVTISGGGVAVTQSVHGSLGWSEAPCQSTTSSNWYFPSGTTAGSAGLYLSVLNPSTTPVVVDLSFVTPTGMVQPINYQGIVLPPEGLQVVNVGSEVQAASTVSTIVSVRTGRVAASEVQLRSGSAAGLSVLPGAPAAQSRWTVPLAQELAGGTSQLDVLNPGGTSEAVTVRLRLASGPVHPLSAQVAAGTTWVLDTSAQTRIPDNDAYTAQIDASGGAGVVVGRLVAAPGSATAPQFGLSNAVDGVSAAAPGGSWVLPPPGTFAAPSVPGAAPEHVALANVSGGAEHYSVYALSAGGRRLVGAGTVPADTTALMSQAQLRSVAFQPIVVSASGPMAVSEDVGPTGNYGVVTMPGIPLGVELGA